MASYGRVSRFYSPNPRGNGAYAACSNYHVLFGRQSRRTRRSGKKCPRKSRLANQFNSNSKIQSSPTNGFSWFLDSNAGYHQPLEESLRTIRLGLVDE